jgi:hypothetical protein
MFNNKYIFTFIIVTFLILSITGAGIFVDDEWASAQQLKQLGEGHQITTNEGGYGYYANGTIGRYFTFRDNNFMYSMALPIVSFPIYELIKFSGDDYTRILIIAIWGLLGVLLFQYLYHMRKLSMRYMKMGIGMITLLMLLNVYLYHNFPITGTFIPSEVLAIVFTNIILFGLFSVTLHKIIDILFTDDIKLKLFAFITTISCTSLIFWVGNCKDHILSVLVATLIVYYLLRYERNNSMQSLSIALILTGLLTWVRIELGVGMLIGIGCYLLLFHFRNIFSNKWTLTISFIAGTIPMWINNFISTGSPFIHPFNAVLSGRTEIYSIEDITAANMIGVGWNYPIESIFHLLLSPKSGAVGLLIIIPLVSIIIPAYLLKRIKLSRIEILLLIITFMSSVYYIVKLAIYIHADIGIMPDMRYFIFFYTTLTLFMVSVLSKIMPSLHYKKIIIYYILAVGLLFILFTTYSATLSDDGTYRDLNRVVNTLATILMGIGLIAVINDIRLNKNYLTYILPIMIAIPMAWQLVMLFIYHTSKVHSYPMFIPITEFIYNYLFGLIL